MHIVVYMLKHGILIVDDELAVQKALKRLFSFMESVHIFTASSAQEAMTYIRENQVSLIISDERMPGVKGSELISFLNRNFPDIIRIIITGYSDHEAIYRAVNKGEVFRYFQKPWDNDELTAAVKQGLDYFEIQSENKVLHQHLKQANDKLKKQNSILEKQVEQRTKDLKQALDSLQELRDKEKLQNEALFRFFLHAFSLHNPIKGKKIQGFLEHLESMFSVKDSDIIAEAIISGIFLSRGGDKLAEVVLSVHGFEKLINVICHMYENYDGSGPMGVAGNSIPLNARLLRIAWDSFELLSKSPENVVAYFLQRKACEYDPDLCDVVISKISQKVNKLETITIPFSLLRPEMKLAQDIELINGTVLLKKENFINSNILTQLTKHKRYLSSIDHIKVYKE